MPDVDRRRLNNPHVAVRRAGLDAGRQGLGIETCQYKAPAMRATWLRGYTDGAQLDLFARSDDDAAHRAGVPARRGDDAGGAF